MNAKKLTATVAAAFVLVTSSSFASDIYRYTDEDGNIHYGDRPTGAPTEERLAIASARTNNDAARAYMEQRYALNQPAEEPAAQSTIPEEVVEEEEMTRAERAAEQRERAQRCQQYRDRLETFMTSRRLYRESDDGEREYLEENEVQEARDRVQELINENCD